MATLTVEYFKKNYESLKDIPDDDVANVLHRLKEDWITTTTSLESVSRDGLIQKNYPLMFVNALKPEEVGLRQHQKQQQQKQQANDSEDMKRKIENIEKMMIESKTDDRNMSKANTEFATDLLTGLSISWRNAYANMNVGVGSVVGNFEWEQALLTGGTGKLSENDGTPSALKWLFGKLDQALAVDGKKLGIRDVKGKKLAPIKADRKVANGKSDGCVAEESILALCERSQESFYTYGMALVEMKTDRTPMNKAQMLLQLAAFSRESVWGQSTILLGTDGNTKWYLVQFEALNSMLITQYVDGRECLNEFESLLKSLKTREAKLRDSKRAKLAPVLEEQFQSEHHLPGASTPGTASLAWTDGAGEGQDAVDKAIENEALLHRLANALAESPLSDGVRPSLPEWSLAKNVVPSYYT